VLSNWRTNKQTPLKTSTSLRYATPVSNDWQTDGVTVALRCAVGCSGVKRVPGIKFSAVSQRLLDVGHDNRVHRRHGLRRLENLLSWCQVDRWDRWLKYRPTLRRTRRPKTVSDRLWWPRSCTQPNYWTTPALISVHWLFDKLLYSPRMVATKKKRNRYNDIYSWK